MATCQQVALPLIGAVKTKVLYKKRLVCVSNFAGAPWLIFHNHELLCCYCIIASLTHAASKFCEKGLYISNFEGKHKVHIKILLAQQNLTNEFVGSEISVSQLDPN